MGVIRAALLTVAFALVGLCWMAGCRTRHDSPSTADLIDREDRQYAELEDLANRVVRLEQEQEASPSPTPSGSSLTMGHRWPEGPSPSPTPTEFFGSDGALNMICNDSNIGDLASVNSTIWRCNGFYWYAMEPTPSPTPTPAADLGDTGCDAAHAGRRNIDMEGSEWRCLWVLADKNSPAKQYRWAQVAASPLPSPSPMPDKDGVPLTCKGDGKADALGFDMSVRCSHGIVVFADNSSPAASPTPTPDRLAARQQFFDCPVKFTARDGAVKYLDMQFMSNEKLQCSYRDGGVN